MLKDGDMIPADIVILKCSDSQVLAAQDVYKNVWIAVNRQKKPLFGSKASNSWLSSGRGVH
jgi:hypothetical protein